MHARAVVFLFFAVPIFVAAAPPAETLDAKVRQTIGSFQGTVGIYARNLVNDAEYST